MLALMTQQMLFIGLPSNVTITSNLTAGGTFGVSGSATLGNTTSDVTTVTGQLTASFGAQVNGGNLVMANTFDIPSNWLEVILAVQPIDLVLFMQTMCTQAIST